MKRFCAGFAIAAAVTVGGPPMPAHAAPPTAAPTPGYDARLQQQNRAAQTYDEPAVRYPAPVHRRHVRRAHGGAH